MSGGPGRVGGPGPCPVQLSLSAPWEPRPVQLQATRLEAQGCCPLGSDHGRPWAPGFALCAEGEGPAGGPAREVTPNSIVAAPLPGPLQHGAQEGDSALAVPGGLGILRLGWRGRGGCGWRLGASRGHWQGLWEQGRRQDATPSTVTAADLSEPTSPVQMGEPPRGCRKAPRAGGGTLSPGPGPSWRGRWVMSHVQAEGAARRRRRGARARRGAASVLLGVEGGSDERTRGRSPPRPLPAPAPGVTGMIGPVEGAAPASRVPASEHGGDCLQHNCPQGTQGLPRTRCQPFVGVRGAGRKGHAAIS